MPSNDSDIFNDTPYQEFSLAEFKAKQSVWAVHALLVVYLLFALIAFETRRRTRWLPTTPSRSTPSTMRRRSTTTRAGLPRQRSYWLCLFSENPMCLLTLTAIALRSVLLQIEFNYGSQFVALCRAFGIVYTLLGACSHFGVYVLLWARQWGLYNTNPLKTLFTKKLRVANISVIVGLAIAMVGGSALHIAAYGKSTATPNGCLYHGPSSNRVVVIATSGVMAVGSFFFQASLLALTLYPLAKQYDTICCHCTKKDSDSVVSWSLVRVQRLVRRISISCAICVVSDVLFGVAMGVHAMLVDHRTTFLFMTYNLNLTVNLVAVVGSFSDWIERLWPCAKRSAAAGVEVYRSNTSEARRTNDGASANAAKQSLEKLKASPDEPSIL